MRRTAVPALAAAVLALTVAACGSAPTAPETPGGAPASSSSATAASGETASRSTAGGAYVTLADYEKDPGAHAGTRVVYFFHADWCPSCRSTEAALRQAGVPDGLTVVEVDFDEATALRQRYGITQQHTFVQVDAGGAALATWTGSRDGEEILAATV